jgi:hypothetical protein
MVTPRRYCAVHGSDLVPDCIECTPPPEPAPPQKPAKATEVSRPPQKDKA